MIVETDGIGASLMPIVCAWCKTSMGAKVCPPHQAGEISTSICPACYRREFTLIPHLPDTGRQPLVRGASTPRSVPYRRISTGTPSQ